MSLVNKVKFTALAGIDADKCPAGSRLCKVLYKEEKKGGVKTGVKRASLGAFIPCVSRMEVEAMIGTGGKPVVAKWVVAHMEALQDKMIRARLDVPGCMDMVEVPSYEDLLTAIGKEVEGSAAVRMSGEAIAAWFGAYLAPVLASTFATRLGATVEDARVRKVVAAYEDNMKLLAGKSALPEAVSVNLVKALDLVSGEESVIMGDGAVMYEKMLERIEALTAQQADLMAL